MPKKIVGLWLWEEIDPAKGQCYINAHCLAPHKKLNFYFENGTFVYVEMDYSYKGKGNEKLGSCTV